MKDLSRLVPYSEDNGKSEKRSPIISMQNFSSGVSSFFYARLMKKFRWADAAVDLRSNPDIPSVLVNRVGTRRHKAWRVQWSFEIEP